ncbi:hypothetical protein F5Y17DRAFT_448318 [Xylariaceae sp. FL0594]|nr:hypothetical protein F5Y17DRAFT_448318 [Xylariaceae sp. FL0594]
MSAKKPLPSPMPPAVVVSSHNRSRRASTVSSLGAVPQVDREHLAQALDKIHTSAKQEGVLTTFNDLAPPPESVTVVENKSTAGDLVPSSLSGLYSRLKEAVGVSGKEKSPATTAATEPPEHSLGNATRKPSATAALPRGDTVQSSIQSPISEPTGSAAPLSPALPATEVQQQQSAKPSSIVNASTASSKSASSSRQSIPHLIKSTSTVATANVSNVSAFKDGSRPPTSSRAEDGSSRSSRRISLTQSNDPHPVVSPTYGEALGLPLIEKASSSARSRRDADAYSVDGNLDSPASPIKHSHLSAPKPPLWREEPHADPLSAQTRPTGRHMARRPAVIDRINRPQNSDSRSRSSSISRGTAEATPVNSSAHNSIHHESFSQATQHRRMKSGDYRIPGTTAVEGAPEAVSAKLESMRKQVLSKQFWMADETCKECFLCGSPFTAFRRKHHCRTCGCIFDSRCTSIISGQRFGVQGTLRCCKTCLSVIRQRQDGNLSNLSDDSADDSYLPAIFRPHQSGLAASSPAARRSRGEVSSDWAEDLNGHSRHMATPMMAIPATKRLGESSNRNSAVLEIDAPQLSRPSSSRSLRSLSSIRPQSSGHRRHNSKHNLWSRLRPPTDDRAPFRKSANEEAARRPGLPAFHDDNVIDPDLAPYMSDESSEDEHMSIMGTLAGSDHHLAGIDQDKSAFGPYLAVGRRIRNRAQAEKSTSGFSYTSRGADEYHHRSSRRRNLSTASGHQVAHIRSPRPRTATNNKGPAAGSNETIPYPGSSSRPNAAHLTRSSSMKGEKEPRLELNPASMLHVRKLLRQLLEDSHITTVAAWEKALVPILLKCTSSVDPDIDRGDDIDIRHYVKLKKIPGGRPSDTSYVPGVVFTKKLALKTMPRRMPSPRVVIISFPIEYQRHQHHFMSLQPVIEQEREFLKQLVNRIITLRPQLLLTEKSVSGLALQMLSDAKIAVAYNVKPSVLSAVSRCLETEIISSIDMLALPPQQFQTGKSAGFEVKTFVSDDIPGRKKTYIFLSSSQEELGCTIALRGAPTSTLAKLKRITEFMVYVVYSLKLESCLMRDSLIQLPTTEDLSRNSTQPGDETGPSAAAGKTPDASDERQRTFSTTTLDESVSTRSSDGADPASTAQSSNGEGGQDAKGSQPPRETEGKLVSVHESHAHTHNDNLVPDDVPMPTFYSDMVAKYETKILSASPFVKFAQPYLLMNAREQERRLVYLKRLRDQDMFEERGDEEKPKPQRFQLIKPEMVHQTDQKAPRHIMEILHAIHDAQYDKALYNYQTQTRSWENYIQGNLDLFDPYAHQNIVVLHSVVCTETKVPCVEPALMGMSFYDHHTDHRMEPDCTLGQYIEDLVYGAESTCTSIGCDRKMYEHHRTYVHGEARLTFFVDHEATGKTRGDGITMWSYCKICKRETRETEMSRFTWKYSFGKYLELSFWSRGTHLVRDESAGGWDCPHDHHRDHIRYFGLEDKVVRVHYDPIDLLEIIVPRARITWKVEHDLNMKNGIFSHCQDRWTRFTASVKARLKAIKLDKIAPEKAESGKAEIERLTKRIQEDHASIVRKLQEKYMNSKYYEVIPFNVVLRDMLVKVTEWDAAFATFEADFLPSEKDLRKLTMNHVRDVFAKGTMASNDTGTEMIELPEKDSEQTAPELDPKGAQLAEESPETTGTTESTQPPEMADGPPSTVVSPQRATVDTATDTTLGRVEPLDLATPKATGTVAIAPSVASSPDDMRSSLAISSVPASAEGTATTSAIPAPAPAPGPPGSTPNRPPQGSVVGQAEQFRKQPTGGAENVVRTVVTSGTRRMGSVVSPPLMRAISQPVNTLPTLARANSAVGKKAFGLSKEKDKTAPMDVPPGHELRKIPTNDSTKGEKKLFGLKTHRKANASSIPRFVGKKDSSRVSTIRKHFEQLTQEFEREREKDRKKRAANMSHSRPFLQHSKTRATVEVYQDVADAVHEPAPVEDEAGNAKAPGVADIPAALAEAAEPAARTGGEGQATHDKADAEAVRQSAVEAETDDAVHNTSVAPTDDEQADSDAENSIIDGSTLEEIAESLDPSAELPLEIPRHDRMNFILKSLSNFWNDRSASQWPALDYPLSATDHIFIDSDIIVREDEPSSVIAFVLSSEDYKLKLRSFYEKKEEQQEQQQQVQQVQTGGEAMAADFDKRLTEEQLETSLISNSSRHFKYQFNEGSAKMLVKIFYAEQFDALRRKCGVADRIVESLSRCVPWDSKGGKTKSVFLKTQDDRLVMKALSQIETQAFLNFAPAYFSLMAEALFHDLPSVIAKMLGFFQVVIKNPESNTETKLDLLLMENLFYDRAPNRIFDLKGSMRNRKIHSTGEQNEVLQDENMVEYIYESPLFAREHSKKLLRASVFNDTLFLARQEVMDYSLMIAVDEVRKELVVGIIDCIRTYTWDKKLESWIKDRGFAGGGRNRPTVTSPKEYKSRFREAMARYILQAPNCWHLFNAPPGTGRHRSEGHNNTADDATVAAG